MSQILIDEAKLLKWISALKNCYDVDVYPSDGSTEQDKAIAEMIQALEKPAQPAREPLTDEQEREAFETYVRYTPLGSYSTDRRGDGKYWSSHTQLMWDTWKARAAHGITKGGT